MRADRYAEALLSAVEALNVKRVGAIGGVYGAMPYDQDREVSCVYSLPKMKKSLEQYAVEFSNYEGGTTIGTYLVDAAEKHNLEFFVFYAFVPAYNFAELSDVVQAISIEHDFKAWYDMMRRFNHMFEMEIDLDELEEQSYELVVSMDAKIAELDEQMPGLDVRSYLEEVADQFEAESFVAPLSDVWRRGLDNLLSDGEHRSRDEAEDDEGNEEELE